MHESGACLGRLQNFEAPFVMMDFWSTVTLALAQFNVGNQACHDVAERATEAGFLVFAPVAPLILLASALPLLWAA